LLNLLTILSFEIGINYQNLHFLQVLIIYERLNPVVKSIKSITTWLDNCPPSGAKESERK
jgi:hypothetical protein